MTDSNYESVEKALRRLVSDLVERQGRLSRAYMAVLFECVSGKKRKKSHTQISQSNYGRFFESDCGRDAFGKVGNGLDMNKTHHLLMIMMICCSFGDAAVCWCLEGPANDSATTTASRLDSNTATCSFFYC